MNVGTHTKKKGIPTWRGQEWQEISTLRVCQRRKTANSWQNSRILVRPYDDHPFICWCRAVDPNNLQKTSEAVSDKLSGTPTIVFWPQG